MQVYSWMECDKGTYLNLPVTAEQKIKIKLKSFAI